MTSAARLVIDSATQAADEFQKRLKVYAEAWGHAEHLQ